ncbi:MAG TPA: cysteine desulfurase family protein [Gammaproteobacteria bacterium]|nr:cysteine desulfurase family protein [Gammaproteobacteria bacterium]
MTPRAVPRAEIYLDYAATAPIDPAVLEAMTDCLRDTYANPSSQHLPGRRARKLVEAAREQVAARVDAQPARIVFTSGATESNNLALQGVLGRRSGLRPQLVTSRIEHKSVLDTARALQASGVEVAYVDCDGRGVIEPERVADAITDRTVLVSIMHVNNETGVIQDVAAIAAVCRSRGVPLHVDAAQSVGKLPVELRRWGVDLCSLTAHKLCGPKGVGALYVTEAVNVSPLLHGGEQERGLRAGTLATHQIVGMGKAYDLADPNVEGPRLAQLRDRLWGNLKNIPEVRLNGDPERRAPHLLNVSFPGVEGESLRLAIADIAVSAGSACAADSPEASHVLTGMGLSDVLAASSLRFSVGRFTSDFEVAEAGVRVAEEVGRLRALAISAPAWCRT